MERECIAGLYRSAGRAVGAEFTSDDVSLLYSKVFHVPSDTDETHAAMRKIAGGDDSWSCAGENVLDVLLEMEREREKKEKLYWDHQLLSVGNLNSLYVVDKPLVISPHALNFLHQQSGQNAPVNAHNRSNSFSVQSCTFDTGSSQRERLMGKREQHERVRGVRRLKKAARQCWARLASEGVQSILLPSLWKCKSPGVRGQAWGCVTLTDALLLVEVKYDVVTHLLYTEMLQEHHTPSIWETMLPWQQWEEEQVLEDLAEEALESGDMLHLAELPGAFRIYRAYLGASSKQSWSAVSLLCELNTFRREERDTLTVLGEKLDRKSLTLLCLHIKLATLRAQREKMSYSALLAARQSWETWPYVKSPCGADQAAVWLHGEEESQKTDFIAESPQQQAVLQLLVLTQEQERKHLIKLVHGVSLKDLQEPGCGAPPKEDGHKQAALRNGCIKRLRKIHAGLQTHNVSQTTLRQTNPHQQHQTNMWSQHQLEDCSRLLLIHLMELQEVRATAVMQALIDKSPQHIQVLRDEYESELKAQCYTDPLQLLISDAYPYPDSTENRGSEQITAQPSSSGEVDAQNSSDRPAEALSTDSSRSESREPNGVQDADSTERQDVCTDCGAAMEDLPYLEIVCVSDPTSNTHQSLAPEEGAQVDEGSTTNIPESFEKQGSLITLAWSKPPDDNTDNEGQSQDVEDSVQTLVQPSDIHDPADTLERDQENLTHTLFRSDSTGHPDPQSADQQCNTVREFTLEGETDEPEKGNTVSEPDIPSHALVTKTLQDIQPHVLVDPAEIEQHDGDLCSRLTDKTVDVEREGAEVEMCPTEAESEPWDSEDQKCSSPVTVDCSPAEREPTLTERDQAREQVSAMERERTMRSLVDMQKKVEQRQQRDRERQLLRVQERLSIIQNKKAEEDLLGLKHTDRLRHLTQDLPQEDKNQQKTVVRERLEQLRRERSYVMQSKRDRNTAGFKELLGPVALHSTETDEGAD